MLGITFDTARAARAGGPAQTPKTDAAQKKPSFGEVLRSVDRRGRDLDPLFAEASETYGVPQPLLRAIAFHESGFETGAVSSAGAMGLMQLMPATVETMGVRDPFDARDNIMGGAKLLGQYLEKYDGDLKLTLAAYGAGSGAVAKYGGVPPYEETRGFVRDILSAVDPSAVGGGEDRAATRCPGLEEQIRAFDDFTQDDYRALLQILRYGLLADEEDGAAPAIPGPSWIRL